MGKSSLLNALCGEEGARRPRAGRTRAAVRVPLCATSAGRARSLADTAGARRRDARARGAAAPVELARLEAAAARDAAHALALAGVCLLVLDGAGRGSRA